MCGKDLKNLNQTSHRKNVLLTIAGIVSILVLGSLIIYLLPDAIDQAFQIGRFK